MYTLVRRFIKTGIFFLLAGLVLGSWMMWGRIRPIGSQIGEARGEKF